ncbi:MAG TPA: hypothetical protein VL403_09805 [Candidatus Kryptonia bacterium]|nr:hypothetical protein [Candidatus Kryptonia bacterium]
MRNARASPVGSIARALGEVTGLSHMGVALRTVEPGWAGTNRHFHSVEEERTYVLARVGTVRIGPHRLAVRAGSFVGFLAGPGYALAMTDSRLVRTTSSVSAADGRSDTDSTTVSVR